MIRSGLGQTEQEAAGSLNNTNHYYWLAHCSRSDRYQVFDMSLQGPGNKNYHSWASHCKPKLGSRNPAQQALHCTYCKYSGKLLND